MILKIFLRLAFLLSGILALGLAIVALCKGNTKDGILTLTFDVPNITSTIKLPRPVDFRPPLGSILSSAQGAAGTASAAQAAASSIISQAQNITEAIARDIPRNLSFGTKFYCVGFTNHTDCHSLPFKLSDVLPQSIANELEKFQTFHKMLGIVLSGEVHVFSIMGPTVISIVIVMCVIGFCVVVRLMKFLILGLSLICFVVLLFPTTVFYILSSKAKLLPIKAEAGLAGQAFLGTLVSVSGMSIIAAFMFAFL